MLYEIGLFTIGVLCDVSFFLFFFFFLRASVRDLSTVNPIFKSVKRISFPKKNGIYLTPYLLGSFDFPRGFLNNRENRENT